MRRLALTLGVLLALSATAHAVPNTLAFTARITSTTSGPVGGEHSVRFTIFDAESDGNQLWQESYDAVPVEDGLFFAALGSKTPLADAVFAPPAIWLQIDIDGTPQEPRIGILSVPYAVRAGVAEKLGSLTEADVALKSDLTSSNSGPIGVDRFSCYADLAAEGKLDGSGMDDLLTLMQSDARYAGAGHAHDASAIGSGTLDNARYDAYGNLGAAGRLDLADASDVLLLTQGDGRYAALGHNHDGVYAAAAHNHDASAITAGTLSTSRYDAYQDLSDAGQIDFNQAGDLVRRQDLQAYENTGANYSGCGSYVVASCGIFPGFTSGPACDQIPVGGLCRAVGGGVCSGTAGGTCGDGGTWYLKVSP